MASVSELRQLLKQDGDGNNLYEHLTQTLMKILLDKPKNAYDMFELISADVKVNPLNPDPTVGKGVPPTPDEITKQLGWAKACSALFKVPDEPPEVNVKFPDLMDESNLWEWTGLSYGRARTYRLYLSIKKFSETLPADVDRLRFFGKISTRGEPYYILEGLTVDEKEDLDSNKEEGKSGANKYTYWVTQNIESAKWIALPPVTMAQVVISRQFKRLLTGDLEAGVPSHPPFPGSEKNLLRAQIARIVGETSISPAGFFEVEEDSDPPALKLAEAETINESFPKPPAELKDPEAWNHHEFELNKLGRVTAMPEQLDDAGEPIEVDDPVEATPPLKAIESEAWAFRVCPAGAGESASSIVVARSLKWPHAYAIAAGKRFINIYNGNGISYEPVTYTPPPPGAILSEWTPVEDEEPLLETADPRTDPTPPEPENPEEEE